MPAAEILTIGTELLLGEIVDTNSQYIARRVRDAGIDLFWTSTVGDNEQRIADAVNLGLARSDIVLCTGGLGPTIDDVTREAIARALGRELEFRPELWEQIVARFARFRRTPTENNKRQAYVPQGAVALDNPVGTAPSFLVEQDGKVVAAMPGVPNEMAFILEHRLLPYFAERYTLKVVIRSRVLHTAGIGESRIDEKIADLEQLANPTVGLAAHAGSVDVRLTAKADSSDEANALLADLESKVRERLGDWVYGVDEQSLPDVIVRRLAENAWTLAIAESGLGGLIGEAFSGAENVQVIPFDELENGQGPENIQSIAETLRSRSGTQIALAARLKLIEEESLLELAVASPHHTRNNSFSFGAPGDINSRWASNTALARLYRELQRNASQADG